MSRAFIGNETKLLMEKNPYVMRDCNAILKEVENLFSEMEASNMSFCDKVSNEDPEKTSLTTASIQASTFEYKNKNGEDKTGVNYRVYVNCQTPSGVTISFNPKVFGNKLTFGDMTLTLKDKDGALVKEEVDGVEKVYTLNGAEDIKSMIKGDGEKQNAFRAFVDKLNSLTEITEKQLHQSRSRSSNYKPFYVARSTQEVLDGTGSAIYMSQELKDWFKESVDKMSALAMKMYDKAQADGTMLKVEKDSVQNKGEKYLADASMRICIEPKMQVTRDAEGNIIRNGDGKAQMKPVLNESGAIEYDTTISLSGTGVIFTVDVAEEATLRYVRNEAWIDNKPNFQFGVKAINEKASEDVKKFVASMNDFLPEFVPNREGGDSPMWELYQRVRKALNDKSETLLDENGNAMVNDAGNVRKEEYAQYIKPEGNFKASVDIYSNVNKDIVIRLFENKNNTISAQYIHFLGEGEKPNIIPINRKTLGELIKSDAVKDILKKEISGLSSDERSTRDDGMER